MRGAGALCRFDGLDQGRITVADARLRYGNIILNEKPGFLAGL